MLRIPAHSHIIKPSYGYMDTTNIYISLYVDGGAAVPSGWKKQNICYLDTISGLGCLLPRNKYTALAPYFVSVSVGEGNIYSPTVSCVKGLV